MSMENTSGQGPQAQLPPELKQYNWGAFFLNWIWGLGNNTFITLTVFAASIAGIIPIIGAFVPLGLCIWFGMKGNEWAWQNKHWDSIEHFQSVQKTWALVGGILFAIAVLAMVIMIPVIIAAAAKAGALQK